jgi:2-haloacid dehalogenase
MRMIDLSRFDAITLDCYGTMIDWEAGIVAAAREIAEHHDILSAPERILALYGELEPAIEHGEYKSYRTVLERVMRAMAPRLGFEATDAECAAFAESVKRWPSFPDSPAALAALHRRFKLGVISNVDDDLFAESERLLGLKFDWVVTAAQVKSYKPSHNNFLRAHEIVGVPRERILHVAQSMFHDIVPAKALGMTAVWVNRRGGRPGGAAPDAQATPDLEVSSLAALAEAVAAS